MPDVRWGLGVAIQICLWFSVCVNLGVALSGPVPKCCVNSPDGHAPHPEEGMHVGEDAVPVMCIKLENYQQYVLLKEKKKCNKIRTIFT